MNIRSVVLLALPLLSGACERTAPWPQSGTFVGFYLHGFEISDFKPAGTRERWWIKWGAEVTRPAPCGPSNPCYAVMRGQLSDPGSYGHLSAYRRELTVTEVLEARPVRSDEISPF
jgi:hypothetical protein